MRFLTIVQFLALTLVKIQIVRFHMRIFLDKFCAIWGLTVFIWSILICMNTKWFWNYLTTPYFSINDGNIFKIGLLNLATFLYFCQKSNIFPKRTWKITYFSMAANSKRYRTKIERLIFLRTHKEEAKRIKSKKSFIMHAIHTAGLPLEFPRG